MNVLAFGTSTQAIEPGYRGSLKIPGDQGKPRWGSQLVTAHQKSQSLGWWIVPLSCLRLSYWRMEMPTDTVNLLPWLIYSRKSLTDMLRSLLTWNSISCEINNISQIEEVLSLPTCLISCVLPWRSSTHPLKLKGSL